MKIALLLLPLMMVPVVLVEVEMVMTLKEVVYWEP
jgi:hypothetical protein